MVQGQLLNAKEKLLMNKLFRNISAILFLVPPHPLGIVPAVLHTVVVHPEEGQEVVLHQGP